MAKPKTTVGAPTDDPPETDSNLSPHSTEAAFNAIKPQLDAIPLAELRQPNFNLQEGAFVVLAADALLREPELRKQIEALAAVHAVDMALIDNLATVARAAWFVRHKLGFAEATHSDASLPAKLVTDATEVRKRMLKCLGYQLEEDAIAQRMLISVRAGSGHLDLANDLIALADMYVKYIDSIRTDAKNYRPGDVALARALADEIIAALGGPATPEAQLWRGYQARAFVLLEKHHEEAIRVGRFLRYRDGGEDLFPTIFSAVRSRPARKAPAENAPEAPAPAASKPE